MDSSVVFARLHQCALPFNTWFLMPIRVRNPNGISVGSAVFAGLTTVTDRPTRQTERYRATVCVTTGRVCGVISYEWIFEEFREQIWLWTREKLTKCWEVGISAPVAGR